MRPIETLGPNSLSVKMTSSLADIIWPALFLRNNLLLGDQKDAAGLRRPLCVWDITKGQSAGAQSFRKALALLMEAVPEETEGASD